MEWRKKWNFMVVQHHQTDRNLNRKKGIFCGGVTPPKRTKIIIEKKEFCGDPHQQTDGILIEKREFGGDSHYH